MSDNYAAVAPPQQNFNQSTAFAAALQRAKQIAAKINPSPGGDTRPKRPLEDGPEPDAKKVAAGPLGLQGNHNNIPVGRPPQQSSGGSSGSGGSMGGPPGGGPPINEDIKVPDKMVGLIIGRGGEQITRLQAESGCKIQMAPDSQGMPERICSLSGTREAISRAKELIMNIVHQRGRSEGLGGLDLGPGLGHNNYQAPHNNQPIGGGGGRNFVEIMVPGPKVGLIIGKGGETIKQLQEKSGAKMVVIQDGPNQEQEKPLRISGDPAKVEYAKQLVYDLIAEKEMQAYNRRGGGGGGGAGGMGRGGGMDDRQYDPYGGSEVEVLVPRAAVGIVIGKGGDMIKKIQQETGARVQFQQAREEGPGERRCYLSGKPQQVEQARQRIEELIDSVHRREDGNNGGGRGGGPGGPGAKGRDRYDNRSNNRNGGNQDFGGGGWDDRRQPQSSQEVTFTVPSSKCGVIIGRGGETIKHINHQSGAHCELDRRSQTNQNATEKTFIIRGEPDQIETAKRIINDKVQMQINYIIVGNNANNLPTAYPGMATQGYTPQNWGVPGYQQWGANNSTSQGSEASTQNGSGMAPMGQPTSGQPDYSVQWAEYYRSIGMIREAEMVEQQLKNKQQQAQPLPLGDAQTAQTMPMPQQAVPANGGQPDYSAQWAMYYRSVGKHKEAEAIEAQMKVKQGQAGGPSVPTTAVMTGTAQTGTAGAYQPYGAYQTPGYYGTQTTGSSAQGVPGQNQYGFPGYGYGGSAPTSGQDN